MRLLELQRRIALAARQLELLSPETRHSCLKYLSYRYLHFQFEPLIPRL